jgi:hypothetical protein
MLQKRGYKVVIMQFLSPFFFILSLYVMNEILSASAKEHLYDDSTPLTPSSGYVRHHRCIR